MKEKMKEVKIGLPTSVVSKNSSLPQNTMNPSTFSHVELEGIAGTTV